MAISPTARTRCPQCDRPLTRWSNGRAFEEYCAVCFERGAPFSVVSFRLDEKVYPDEARRNWLRRQLADWQARRQMRSRREEGR